MKKASFPVRSPCLQSSSANVCQPPKRNPFRNLSAQYAQIVFPNPKVWDFDEKRLHWPSVVRYCKVLLMCVNHQKEIHLGDNFGKSCTCRCNCIDGFCKNFAAKLCSAKLSSDLLTISEEKRKSRKRLTRQKKNATLHIGRF